MNDSDASSQLFQCATAARPTPEMRARLLEEVLRALRERDPSGRVPIGKVLDNDDLIACA